MHADIDLSRHVQPELGCRRTALPRADITISRHVRPVDVELPRRLQILRQLCHDLGQSSRDWVDAARGCFVLSNAIQGPQAGLIDMYYNKNSGEWMISMDGHGHYCGLCLSGEDGTSRTPCCPWAHRSH